MNYFSNQQMMNSLYRQKDSIENLINQYSQPQAPVQNIINTGSNIDFEARILKDDEDASNIIINRRTLFVDEKNKKVLIKETDGSYSKTYDIIVPKDEKDLKIEELENKLKEMEMKLNGLEFKQPICDKSDINGKGQSTSDIKSNGSKSTASEGLDKSSK